MKFINPFQILLVLLFFSSNEAKSQATSNIDAQDIFLSGNEMLIKGNYKSADSLYTIAIKEYYGFDIYFNRALSRLYMNDTIGFCDDIYIAGVTFSYSKADTLFNRLCCNKVDTTYLNWKKKVTDSTNYRYTEELLYCKYEDLILGIIRDTKIERKTIYGKYAVFTTGSNIVEAYEIIDGVKYYYKGILPRGLKGKRKLRQLNNKYNQILRDALNKLLGNDYCAQCQISFVVYLNNEGKPISYGKLDVYDEDGLIEINENFEKLVGDYFNELPIFNPYRFRSRVVSSFFDVEFEFE